MKVFLMTLFATTLTLAQAEARWVPGSLCGLVDSEEEFGTTDNKSYDLSADRLDPRLLKRLPEKTRKQLMVAAGDVARTSGDPQPRNVKEAVDLLREYSDAHTLYVYEVTNGKTFDVVKYFPGDNPAGFIFPQGSSLIIGEISDGDVVCR